MSEGKRFVLVGLGELLWDLLPQGRQMGGAPANFAYHAAAWGEEGVVVSCVGADPLGRELQERLADLGLETRHVAVDGRHPTGTVTVKLDARGAPDFTIHAPVAWDFIPWSAELGELAGRADCVCFGSLAQRAEGSRTTIRRFLEATRPDCLRVFDINLRQAYYSLEVVEESLRRSHVLKLNDSELPTVAALFDLAGNVRDVVGALQRQFGLRLVVLTRGEHGSLLFQGGRAWEHPGTRVTVVDSVGAGDAFTAAVAVGLLRGADLGRIQERANRIAAYVCTQAGATPPMPGELFRS
jgi:fructokinase